MSISSPIEATTAGLSSLYVTPYHLSSATRTLTFLVPLSIREDTTDGR
nr:MAG TPA: hypothetical protein [Caudoviricetes sp.]